MARERWIGGNDRYTCSPPNLDVGPAFTLFCWMRARGVQGTVGLVDRWDGGGGSSSYSLNGDTSGVITGLIYNAGQATLTAPTTIGKYLPFKWNSVGFTHKNTTEVDRLWLNGKMVKAGIGGKNVVNNGSQLEVFDIAVAGLTLAGSLHDVAIWKGELDEGEFLRLHRGARPGNIRSGQLISWWPLETGISGSYNNAPDLSGNARTLSLNQNSLKYDTNPISPTLVTC